MQLTDGHHLAYTIDDDPGVVTIMSTTTDDGAEWAVEVVEPAWPNSRPLYVVADADDLNAFQQVPELWAPMATYDVRTISDLVAHLDSLGAVHEDISGAEAQRMQTEPGDPS